MALFGFVLLVILQTILVVTFFGVGLVAGKFRFPLIGIAALANIVDSVFVAAEFWWLFGVWYPQFVLGSIAICVGVLLIGLAVLISTSALSHTMNVRVNVSFFMLFGRSSGLFQALNTVAVIAMFFVFYKTYALSRGPMTDETIRSAALLFFTVASLPVLVLAVLQGTGNAIKPSLDPLARNVMALASLGGYGLSAWRAAFPFIQFGGTAAMMGYEFQLSTVLAALLVIYAAFVVIPLWLGERRYVQERARVIDAARGVLDDVMHLGRPNLDSSVFAEERTKVSRQLNQMLINLYEDDALLRFFAFWRWGPDHAFHRQGNYWVFHDPASAPGSARTDQPIEVLERPWFQNLIGPEKRVARKFNDATIERVASQYLEEIPNWNYRALVFNALVMVLESLESNNLKVACDRAGLDRDRITREMPQTKTRSIVTVALLAGVPIVSWIASMFQDEIKHMLRSFFNV
jgi:hypothetical protein